MVDWRAVCARPAGFRSVDPDLDGLDRPVLSHCQVPACSLLLGLLNSFDTPLRQILIRSFVGCREYLTNALALNAMLFNAGLFIGMPIAVLLVRLAAIPVTIQAAIKPT